MTASTFARANGDAPPTSGPSDLPADAADDDDLPLRIDTLPADLAPLVLERLTFSNLLALRLVCSRLNSMAYAVTKVTLNRRGHLYIPLLRKFSAVQSLTLEGFEQSWIPRLACVLGVFPRLVRLCLRKSRAAGGGGPVPQQMLTDGVMLGVVGALEAGACPLLNNLNLDERLPEATALQLAGAMPPNGGLLFATIQAHEAVVCAHAQNEAHFPPGRSSRLSQPEWPRMAEWALGAAAGPILPLRGPVRCSSGRREVGALSSCFHAWHVAGARDALARRASRGRARRGRDGAPRRRVPRVPRDHQAAAHAARRGEHAPPRRRDAAHHGGQPYAALDPTRPLD